MPIEVIYYSDPGCPWAYSASPALTVLRWRYGDQLEWRLVTIGLTERPEQYAERGYTAAGMARAYAVLPPLRDALLHRAARAGHSDR